MKFVAKLGPVLRALPASAFVGALGGLATYAVEAGLAHLSLGAELHLGAVGLSCFALLGSMAGAILVSVAGVLGREVRRGVLFSWTLCVLALPALFERGYRMADAAGAGWGSRIGWGVGALLAFALLVLLFAHAARSRGVWLGPLLGVALAHFGVTLYRVLATQLLAPLPVLCLSTGFLAALLVAGLGRRDPTRAVVGSAVFVLAGLAFLRFGYVVFASASPASDRPHLVLLVVDTLRQDVFRDVVATTPEGEAFRSSLGNAAWFENVIATSPWTAPSMASILTGLYPIEHGMERNWSERRLSVGRLSSSVPTLAEALRDEGYATHALVTNGFLHPRSGIHRGLEAYRMLFGPTGHHPLLAPAVRLGLLEFPPYLAAGGVRRALARRLPWLLAEGRPLFLWVHTMDPHHPLAAHPELVEEAPAPESGGRYLKSPPPLGDAPPLPGEA